MHSQFNEEIIIQSHFPLNYIGNCVEIGLGNGSAGSVSLSFEEKGWNCLCIEANPILAEIASDTFHRKNVLNYAVGNENIASVDFHICRLDYENESAVSSLKIDSRLYDDHKHLIKLERTIQVELKTLDTILEEANIFNYIEYY